MSMFNPLISVNLLLYKPEFYLAPCLKSILAQSYDNFELLVIDNNSGDGTAEKAQAIINAAQQRGAKVPFHKIIVNKANLGFSGGHNLGIRESKGELVLLVNQDIVLDEDFLKNIIGIFNRDAKVGSAQGKLLRLKVANEDLVKTETLDNTGFVMLKNRRIIARGQGQPDSGQYEKMEEIFGVDGALPIFRRAALEEAKIDILSHPLSISPSRREGEKVGVDGRSVLEARYEYFDEDFFAYKEDVDLAWRLRLFGWKAYYIPPAMAWHARTSGDSIATNYFAIIRERLKINRFGKYQSFKNQRLMQIKNEQIGLLLSHALWFIPKEIGAWLYVLLFEHYTWRAIKDLFRQAPRAREKRKIIMARKKVSGKEMRKWFK